MTEDALAQIQSLVRSHPTITVRELAAALGFSEERSVYYWLQKAGFRGLKDFKASVLSSPPRVEAEVPRGPLGVAESTPAYELVLIVVQTPEYAPFFLAGDRMVVEMGRPPRDGELALLELDGQPNAVRRYFAGPPALLVHPSNSRRVTLLPADARPQWRGTIVRLIRERP